MFGESKKTGIEVSIEFLTQQFREARYARVKDKEKEQAWRDIVIQRLSVCPESPHILEQNGKLSKLSNEVATTRATVKMWCYIFSGLISVLTLTVGAFIKIILK